MGSPVTELRGDPLWSLEGKKGGRQGCGGEPPGGAQGRAQVRCEGALRASSGRAVAALEEAEDRQHCLPRQGVRGRP